MKTSCPTGGPIRSSLATVARGRYGIASAKARGIEGWNRRPRRLVETRTGLLAEGGLSRRRGERREVFLFFLCVFAPWREPLCGLTPTAISCRRFAAKISLFPLLLRTSNFKLQTSPFLSAPSLQSFRQSPNDGPEGIFNPQSPPKSAIFAGRYGLASLPSDSWAMLVAGMERSAWAGGWNPWDSFRHREMLL